jgi:WD40 repeat protein
MPPTRRKPAHVLFAALAAGALGQPAAAQRPASADRPAPTGEPSRLDSHGDPLPAGAVARLGTARLRHGNLLSGLAFSGDGKRVFASDYYTGVHVWDADTGAEVGRFFEKDPFCDGLAVSPDGKTLAVSLGDLTVRLCDSATGRELGTLPRHGNRVGYFAFSNDSTLLATGDGRPEVSVWDVATRQRIHTVPFPDHVGHVSFSADGKLLAGGTSAGVRVWDLARGVEVRRLKDEAPGRHSLEAAFAPKGDLLAVWGYEDASVRVFEASGAKEVRRFDQERGPAKKSDDPWGWVTSIFVRFSPDGKTLAIVRDVGRIDLWDVETGKKQHTLTGDSSLRPSRLAFSPDGTRLATTASDAWGGDNTIRVWDVTRGEEVTARGGHGAPISSIAVAPAGDTVATAGQDGVIHLWEASTGKHLARLEAHPTRRRLRVTFTNDGRRVIAWPMYGGDGVLRVWDAKTGRPAGRFAVTGPDRFWETVSDDGKTAVSVDLKAKSTRFHDLATGQVIREVPDGAYNPPHALSPSGKAMVCSDGTLRTAPERKDLLPVGHLGVPNPTARFSADGRRLMAAVIPESPVKSFISDPPAEEIAVADAIQAKEVRRFGKPEGKFRPIDAAALSADGKTVVTVWAADPKSGEQVLTLWEADTGRERGHFVGHRGQVRALAITADGRFVVSGGQDTGALVWDATRPRTRDAAVRPASAGGDLAARLKDLAGHNAEQAYASLWALANAPKEAVAFLGSRESLFAATEVRKIERWVRDLDSDRYAERERASRDLGSILDEAEPHLRKALRAKPSAEAQRRIELLLGARSVGSTGRELQRLRVIEVLEHVAAPDAAGVLKRLAAAFPESRVAQEAKGSVGRMERR